MFSAYLQPTATVTIIPDEQVLHAQQLIAIVERNPKKGQIQGQLLTRTLTWTKSVPASGRGHQHAAFARGTITFYNGLLIAQSIPQGTILTGGDGREVVTDAAAFVSPANPPVEGEATVPARAVKIGTSGNIRARDINEGCCGQGILAVNFAPFHGGADARDFTFVTANDIQATSLALTESLSRTFSQTLGNSLQPDQSAIPPTCVLTTNTNHNVGDQVASVSVTVSGKCSSALYARYDLQNEAEILLAGKARALGSHYTSLNGQTVKVFSRRLTAQGNTLAFVMTASTGVWGYRFSPAEEEHIKKLLRGKNRADALKILRELAGVKSATITGTDPIPNNTAGIRMVVLYVVYQDLF